MKTFSELQKELQQIRTEAAKIAARDEKATAILNAAPLGKRGEIKQSILDESNAIEAARTNNRLAFEIVKNNACIALYTEVMPIIIETLKAYEGKPHGEKTAAKIREELKAKTNCFVYITYNEINISALTVDGSQSWDYRITVSGTYNSESGEQNSVLTPDNKIKVLPLDSFMLCYISNTYIENVPEAIKALKAIRAEAYQQQQKLDEICDKYNALAVGNIERIYCNKFIYEKFRR